MNIILFWSRIFFRILKCQNKHIWLKIQQTRMKRINNKTTSNPALNSSQSMVISDVSDFYIYPGLFSHEHLARSFPEHSSSCTFCPTCLWGTVQRSGRRPAQGRGALITRVEFVVKQLWICTKGRVSAAFLKVYILSFSSVTWFLFAKHALG